jgi:LPXTG-motif cell wall-anchored protein
MNAATSVILVIAGVIGSLIGIWLSRRRKK